MRCDDAQPLLSAALDEPLGPADADALAAHVGGCEQCASFQRHIDQLRRELRYESVEAVPDVAPAVLAAVRSPAGRGRGWLPVAAAFAAAVVAGAVFVGLGVRQPVHVAAAGIPERVLAAQSAVQTLRADVEVVERGWHPDVPERTYTGSLTYRAPESLALVLQDSTDYPSAAWVANDTTVVADADTWWTRGPVGCPTELLPDCAGEARARALNGREPFDPSTPLPLDLVVPVRSFTFAAQPQVLGSAEVEGRRAVGVAVTVGQVRPLLDGLRAAGQWRELHPADRAELWLDAEVLVPLSLRLLPADDPERELWAARRGYVDPPGQPLLELHLRNVVYNEPVGDGAFPPAPADAAARVAGFRPGTVPIQPGWLPDGMRPHRSGVVDGRGPRVEVASWTDGRAWVAVRLTADWPGRRLFGDLGEHVRPVDLPGGGVAYAGGGKVGLHGEGVDVVVAGSAGEDALLRVAAGLGVTGRPVPDGWAEAGAGSADGLLLPVGLDGFGEPAVRTDAGGTTAVFTGPGDRAFTLTQAPGDRLTPPLEPDVRGVEVRGVAGRYTPSLGELEWVEPGVGVVSLRSRVLPLAELVAIAETLR